MLTFVLFVVILFVSGASSQQVSNDGCFNVYPNSQVMCLQPFDVCPNVQSPDECRNLCKTKPGCTGVQYQFSTKQCSMFNQSVDTIGAKGPMPRPKPSLRVKRLSCYGAQPALNRNAPDFEYSQLISTGCTSGATTLANTAAPQVTTTSTVALTSPQNLPAQATCPAGKTPILFQYNGVQLSGSSTKQISGTTSDACAKACIDNKLADGSLAPCQSADFNSQTNVCQIFLDAASPLGSGQTSPEPNTVHYEKNCLDSSLVQQCPGPIIIAPQKSLVGFVESALTTSNRQDCINECLNAKARFNFACSSGMFYSSESSNNCILNSESSQTQPTMLIDQDPSEKVDYFEPICSPSVSMNIKAKSRPTRQAPQLPDPVRRRNIIWPGRPNWGSWTRCDGKQSTRFHFKNCKSLNPNKCEVGSEKCDPSQRDKEMQEILNEETSAATTLQPDQGPDGSQLADKIKEKNKRGKGKDKHNESDKTKNKKP